MKHLLLAAKSEIERLRRQNEILNAKVSTMELFATVLHTNPSYPPMGASVDIAWELQRAHDQLEFDEVAKVSGAGSNDETVGS